MSRSLAYAFAHTCYNFHEVLSSSSSIAGGGRTKGRIAYSGLRRKGRRRRSKEEEEEEAQAKTLISHSWPQALLLLLLLFLLRLWPVWGPNVDEYVYRVNQKVK